MKVYNVTFEINGMIISDFTIKANNLKEAKKIAQFHKRDTPEIVWSIYHKVKTNVRLIRNE